MKLFLPALAAGALLVTAQAQAFNLLFLKDSPVADFDSVDTGLMVEAFYHAMNDTEDGVASEWKNEDTGHYGVIVPSATAVEGSQTCRDVMIENHSKDNTAVSNLRFCKTDGDRWAVVEQ